MGNVTEEGAAKKRLITRSDFDGLVCAMLLKELGLIDEIKFVHPKDVQDGKVDITSNDITTNLPFDDRVGLAFDHHESELLRRRREVGRAGGVRLLRRREGLHKGFRRDHVGR